MPDAFLEERFHQASAYFRDGQWDLAQACCRAMISHDPNDYGAHHLLALCLEKADRLPEAAAACLRAILIAPTLPAPYVHLGNICVAMEQFQDALTAFDTALELDPAQGGAVIGKARVLWQLKRPADALPFFRQAAQTFPDNIQVLTEFGRAAKAAGRIDDTQTALRRAAELAPNNGKTLTNLAYFLFNDTDRHQEALDIQRRAIAVAPNDPTVLYNHAEICLGLGLFEEGWRHYEWRRVAYANLLQNPFRSHPEWDGGDVNGRVILVRAEQGYGDTIQFLRFIDMLRQRGAEVILQVGTALVPLARTIPGLRKVVSLDEDPGPFDVQQLFMSLPHVLGLTREGDLGMTRPYLHAEAGLAAAWRDRLAQAGPGLRVGIVWAGSPSNGGDSRRSIPMGQIAAALSALAPDIRLFGLQKFGENDARVTDDVIAGLIDLSADLHSFADTAAVIAGLDLVIAVDTAVAHLAGAMGKPLWVLLPFAADWRWQKGRTDSPWYPSARLFRQSRHDDWPDVLDRVVAAVNIWATQASGRRDAMSDTYLEEQFQQASAYLRDGQLDLAQACCRAMISHDPNDYGAHHLLALCLEKADRLPEAAAACLRAILIAPTLPAPYVHLGNLCVAMEQFEDALTAFDTVLELDPAAGDAVIGKARVLSRLQRPAEALPWLRQAAQTFPDDIQVLTEFGLAVKAAGLLDEARPALRRAAELAPDNGRVLTNLASFLFHDTGWTREALEIQHRAIAAAPDDAMVRYNHALICLGLGLFEEGWRHYEWRRQAHAAALRKPILSHPEWRGDDLAGRTILVRAEQGYGDTIQFLRFIDNLRQRGAEVTLKVGSALKPLVETMPGLRKVVSLDEDPGPFDVHQLMMSLPHVLGLTRESDLGMTRPYVHADPGLAATWRARLAQAGPGLRVGIVWAGNPGYGADATRSIPMGQIAAALSALAPDIRLFGLQKFGENDARVTEDVIAGLIDLSADLHSFADTAAVIAGLDLVIAVDTAVAHLAGAMGKPLWVLLPFAPDWRWQQDRTDSPWYPSARLFRQSRHNDWPGVLDRVVAAVNARAAQGGQPAADR